jgi:hypothetical protein
MKDYKQKSIEILQDTMEYKGDHYREEPALICPLETLTRQIELKAIRLTEAINLNKKADEAKDIMVYAALALARINKELSNPTDRTNYEDDLK